MYSAVTGWIVSLTTILRMSAEAEAAKNKTRVPRMMVSRGSFMAMAARDSRNGHRATFIVPSYAPTGLTQLTVSTHGCAVGCILAPLRGLPGLMFRSRLRSQFLRVFDDRIQSIRATHCCR